MIERKVMPKFLELLPGISPVTPRLGHSVYFLVKEGRIVYIGTSKNPLSRLRDHNNDKEKDFDDAYIWPIAAGEVAARKAENALIQITRPLYNGYRWRSTVLKKDQRAILRELCPKVIETVDMLGSDTKEIHWGPVEIVAGPYAGLRGYYDDDDVQVARPCSYCRSSLSTAENFDDDKCTCKYQQRAIVYLGAFTCGDYQLIPHVWLKEVCPAENPFGHDDIIYDLWPGLREAHIQLREEGMVREAAEAMADEGNPNG